MKFTKEEKQAFRDYAHKGPVNHESSQRKASKAYRLIRHYLTPAEHNEVTIGRGHSYIGESRREFDLAMKKVYKRLGLK